MHLRDEAKQPVRPRDFWLAVGAAVVLIGIICVYSGPLEHSPAARWVSAILIVSLWSTSLWRIVRFGWRAYSWSDAAVLLGVTFIFGKDVWPHAPAIVGKVADNGIFLIAIGILAPYFTRGKRAKNSAKTG